MKVYFICDESGAKGYSDKNENYFGEIGLIAGFVLPEKHINKTRLELDKIKCKYLTEKKLHITDITPGNQVKLRNEIFTYFKGKNIVCLYEAIHTEGFYKHSEFLIELIEKARKQCRSKVKISKNPTKELLHERLFQGAFGKAAAYCVDRISKQSHITVITDRVDEKIKSRFSSAALAFLNCGKNEEVKTVTGFDPEKEEVVSGKIISRTEDPANLLGDFSGIEFSIKIEDSSLTLAADVLANCVFTILKVEQKAT